MEYEIGAPGKAYTDWAAQMAVGLGTGVPWVMCKQDDAPDPVVSDPLTFIFLHLFPVMFWNSFVDGFMLSSVFLVGLLLNIVLS